MYTQERAYNVTDIVVGKRPEFQFWTRLIAFHIALLLPEKV